MTKRIYPKFGLCSNSNSPIFQTGNQFLRWGGNIQKYYRGGKGRKPLTQTTTPGYTDQEVSDYYRNTLMNDWDLRAKMMDQLHQGYMMEEAATLGYKNENAWDNIPASDAGRASAYTTLRHGNTTNDVSDLGFTEANDALQYLKQFRGSLNPRTTQHPTNTWKPLLSTYESQDPNAFLQTPGALNQVRMFMQNQNK